MNWAFEICVQDVENVLYKNKVSLTDKEIEEIFDTKLDKLEIEKAALSETEFDLQILAAYKEIGVQLKELKII